MHEKRLTRPGMLHVQRYILSLCVAVLAIWQAIERLSGVQWRSSYAGLLAFRFGRLQLFLGT
jgi:hypothetical protein